MCNCDDSDYTDWFDFWKGEEVAKKKRNDEIDAIRKSEAEKNCMTCKEKEKEADEKAETLAKAVKQKCEKLKTVVREKVGKCFSDQSEKPKEGKEDAKAENSEKEKTETAKKGGQEDKKDSSAESSGGWFSSLVSSVPVAGIPDLTVDDSKIQGKYNMVKSENFDEYMKELGVGYVLRTLGSTSKPVTEITKDDKNEDWRIKTSTTFKTTDIKFKMGVPFNEETADGRKCNSTITKLGGRLIHDQKCNGKDYRIVRDFKDDEMTMTLTAGNVVAKRVYKKT